MDRLALSKIFHDLKKPKLLPPTNTNFYGLASVSEPSIILLDFIKLNISK
jgi:hypothetical protein